ncbi:hypothetical protein Pelo_17991 [Pelomyxa schiedti]|nr:hypothetical protein Pelo_17991 [Pelomyxa schiedti]
MHRSLVTEQTVLRIGDQQVHLTRVFDREAPQLRIDPRTTTTAKAQALALLCAPVVANRRRPNPPSPSPSSSSSLSRASPHLCGSSTMVSPALVEWAQSTALARQWAKDWVLRPTTQVVFALPISEPFWMVPDGHRSFVCVSVSPTLGLVSSHWFKLLSNEQVSGCVGDGRVLVDLSPHDCGEIRRFSIMDVVPRGVGVHSRDTAVGDNGGPIGMRYQVYTEQLLEASSSLKCNRRWIVGVWRCKKICVWKVHSSDGDCGGVKVSEERQFKVVDVAEALFSPLCDDVLVTFNEVAEVMEFIDLEASFSGKNLVVKSRQQCKLGQLLKGILWMPDGSTCTLGGWSRAENILIDTTTRKEVNFFPYEMDVTPVGSHHVLAVTLMPCTEFQVYSTSNLTTPSLRVPCTWASASDPTGLIASTRHQSEGAKATEIKFALHDGATGFHIGDFTIPVPKTFHFLGC